MTNPLTTTVLPLSLFIIMLGMGMSLVIADFKRVLIYPKAVTIGLIGQLLLLPVIGFFIVKLFPMSPELAVGVMILAACPGGVTSNMVTHLAKGDTALSITLTAIASVLTFITIPLIINFALGQFMGTEQVFQLPVKKTMLTLFVITLLPVSIGMLIRAKYPEFAMRQKQNVNRFATFVFVMLFFIIVYTSQERLMTAVKLSGVACLVLNIVMVIVGYLFARVSGLDDIQSRSITIEVGLQNTTLAFVIAGTILENSTYGIPAAIYSIFMYLSAGALIAWGRKRVVA